MPNDGAEQRRWRSPTRHRIQDFDYSSADAVYFVTICANGGSPFLDPRLAREIVQSLQWFRAKRGIAIYAYCLMPDHLHLLIQLPGEQSLGTVIGAFKTWTTRQSWRLRYTGVLWQPRFYDHIVRREESAQTIARYILHNPVRKGLVEDAEKYEWSGMPDAVR